MAQKTKPQTGAATKCSNCGMPREEWPNREGFSSNGQTYCCKGCADDTGCTCG